MNLEYQISQVYQKEVEVEKSKFYGYFFPCFSKKEFDIFLEKLRKDNLKARHFCYAYIIDGNIKYSDDGEPQGSAGKPILSVIKNNNMNNCAIVVIRYFGGILLGSGRLLRTYSATASEVFKSARLCQMVEEFIIKIEVELNSYDLIKKYLNKKRFSIKDTNFNDKIEIVFYAPLDFDENLESIFFGKLKIVEEGVIKHSKEV